MMNKQFSIIRNFLARIFNRSFLKGLIEILIIIAWAIWVGRVYLNFSDDIIPSGGEFLMGIQSHFSWRLLKECGGCFFWNGFTNGGTPAFVEVHGSWLHPLVAIPALLFDELSGAKITIVLGLILAGIAQWWLCKVLKIGVISRIWSSMMVVVSGHLAGKLDMGLVPLVISVASCSLVIPPAIDLAINGRRRTSILLAVTLALAMVSGQGYIQIGLMLTIFPALLILLFDNNFHLKPQWKYFIFAGVLAFFLAGLFTVPLLHFGPNLGKDIDPYFTSWQPFKYIALNLLIDNPDFYFSTVLSKQPFPYLYINYVGWIPVVFAVFALVKLFGKDRYLASFFVTAILLIFATASGLTFKLLGYFNPDNSFAIRNPSFIASLAVPLVLALAAMAIDILLQNKNAWLTLSRNVEGKQKEYLRLNVSWIVLLPMALALVSALEFGDNWMRTQDTVKVEQNVIEKLKTPTTQWVQTPFGEHFWLLPAMNANIKIANYFRPWHWSSRDKPGPIMMGFRNEPAPEDGELLGTYDEIFITQSPQNEYAYIQTNSGFIPCAAYSRGGNIDVDCKTEEPGILIVKENSWTGWKLKMDGQLGIIAAGDWLSAKVPAGVHHFEFRFRPWDVPVGIVLTIIGVFFAVWLWWKNPEQESEVTPSNEG